MNTDSLVPPPPAPGSRPRRAAWLVLAFLVAAGALTSFLSRPRRQEPADPEPATSEPLLLPAGEGSHAVVEPRREAAGFVTFPDDTAVIGVTVGEEDRAYVVKTLEPIPQHVLNDLFGDLPVSVTYCALRDCAKAFVGRVGGGPLDLRAGGFEDEGGMLLRTGGGLYYQETGKPFDPDSDRFFPYPVLACARATWKEWREAHPDTTLAYYPTLSIGAWRSTFPANRVAAPDDAPVVGVTVEGRHRAYLVEAFDDITNYVVCDALGGERVAVAYCPRTGRARAYVGPAVEQTRGLSFAGWDARSPDGGMLLAVDGDLYHQETGKPVYREEGALPARAAPAARTTWGEWKGAHPDTSLYVGGRDEHVRLPAREDGAARLLTGLQHALPFVPAFLWLVGLVASRFRGRKGPRVQEAQGSADFLTL